jgi:hypothetical protein
MNAVKQNCLLGNVIKQKIIHFVAAPHVEVIINMIKLKTVSQDQDSLVVHFAIYCHS